jgi:hypothetical protein
MVSGAELPAVKALAGAAKEALNDADEKQQLLELAKHSPTMQLAAETLARRIAVKQAILLKLYMPLAAMLGIGKAYFADQFATDLADHVSEIPDEHLTTPPSSVALPAMQGLAFSLEEPDLKEMYLKLLAAASDDRRPYDAHPSFAQIICELSSNEARLLQWCLSRVHHPIFRVKFMTAPNAWQALKYNVMDWPDDGPPLLDEVNARSAYVDNWVRLGLVEINYTEFLGHTPPSSDPYGYVEHRPDYPTVDSVRDENGQPQPFPSVAFDKGVLRVTDFGQRFLRAIS